MPGFFFVLAGAISLLNFCCSLKRHHARKEDFTVLAVCTSATATKSLGDPSDEASAEAPAKKASACTQVVLELSRSISLFPFVARSKIALHATIVPTMTLQRL